MDITMVTISYNKQKKLINTFIIYLYKPTSKEKLSTEIQWI
jgi:hypothetical protein